MGNKYVCDKHGEKDMGWIDGEGKKYCPECFSLLKEQPKDRYVVYTKEEYARYFFDELIEYDMTTDEIINSMNRCWEKTSKGHSFVIRDMNKKNFFVSAEYLDKMHGIDKGSKYRNIKVLSINTIWNRIGEQTGIEILFEMPDGKKKIKRIDFMDIVRESNKEYVSDLEYSTGEDIRIVVKVDIEQMQKIDEIIKAFDALKKNKRIGVGE